MKRDDNHQDDDLILFKEQMRDVKPLRNSGRATLKKPSNLQAQLTARKRATEHLSEHKVNTLSSVDYIEQVQPHETLSFKRDGLQHNVFKSLRLGKISPQAELDLHGHTVNEAREQLVLFIEACSQEGIRVAIITHGHGEFRERPALLKSCVNQWLKEINQVLAFHSAIPKHGGSGASYVMLRKSSLNTK